MRSLSLGLAELIILAGIVGLPLLILAVVALAVVRTRRTEAPRPWKWFALLVSILIGLPLVLFVLGLSLVTPVRVRRSSVPTSQAVIVTAGPTTDRLDDTPSGTPAPGMSPPNPTPVNDTGAASWSIVPDTWLEAIAIPSLIAAPIVFVGAALVAAVLSRWPGHAVADRAVRSRYLLLALALWVGLSLFLTLDLGLNLAVSIYPGFVAAYAALWVLIGLLLLYRRPIREQALILTLFVALLFAVRFVNWNSRKPFLRDLQSIRAGMTSAQVEQIMGRYQKGGGRPLESPATRVDARGEILTGTLTYRHTDEAWGNSDWGVVTFEDGRVVHTDFSPD
jgi:hypothetical protein